MTLIDPALIAIMQRKGQAPQRKKARPPKTKAELVYIGPGNDQPLVGPRQMRRRYARQQLKRQRRLVLGPLITEADIPEGSLLSDATLERIRAGLYRVGREMTPPAPRSTAKRRKKRG